MGLTPGDNAGESSANELRERIWSVISFDRHEAGSVTYDEASRKIEELERAHVAGLCIVTDDAAARAHRA